MLSESTIKSLTDVLKKNDCQVTHCDVNPNNIVNIWYINRDILPDMVFTSQMPLYICLNGKSNTYAVPNRLQPIIEKWIDEITTKERQQETARLYKMELLDKTSLLLPRLWPIIK